MKIGNLKILKIGILENYLNIKVYKIGILENYLKMEVLKIKFKNWNFEELLKMKILKIDEVSQVCGIT